MIIRSEVNSNNESVDTLPYVVAQVPKQHIAQNPEGLKPEAVNHPSHYNSGDIETIDAIEDWGFGQGFNLGNAIKYISRANHKNDCLEDLEKARWYLDREIARLKKTMKAY